MNGRTEGWPFGSRCLIWNGDLHPERTGKIVTVGRWWRRGEAVTRSNATVWVAYRLLQEVDLPEEHAELVEGRRFLLHPPEFMFPIDFSLGDQEQDRIRERLESLGEGMVEHGRALGLI